MEFDALHENRIKVFERDGYICRYCQKQLTRFTATSDHVKPIAEGGDNSLDNLVNGCSGLQWKETGAGFGKRPAREI